MQQMPSRQLLRVEQFCIIVVFHNISKQINYKSYTYLFYLVCFSSIIRQKCVYNKLCLLMWWNRLFIQREMKKNYEFLFIFTLLDDCSIWQISLISNNKQSCFVIFFSLLISQFFTFWLIDRSVCKEKINGKIYHERLRHISLPKS